MLVPTPAAAAYAVDTNSAIGKKWTSLGGAGVVGDPTSAVTAAPDGIGIYQQFEHGAIIWSGWYGATYLSTSLMTKWLTPHSKGVSGSRDIWDAVGYPTRDFAAVAGGELNPPYEWVECAKGRLYAYGGGDAVAVFGQVYLDWLTMGGLGHPTADASTISGGAYQDFAGGRIYLKDGAPRAYAVTGEVKSRYLSMGGPASFLGFPKGNTVQVRNEMVYLGDMSEFEGGAIYRNAAKSLSCAIGKNILDAWRGQHGGPTGWLGMPESDQTRSPGGTRDYVDFANGVIVSPGAGGILTEAYKDLTVRIGKLWGYGSDGVLDNTQGLYVQSWLREEGYGLLAYTQFPALAPSETYSGGIDDVGWSAALNPSAGHLTGGYRAGIELQGWDYDAISDYDWLGTVYKYFNVDNLWGTQDLGTTTASNGTGNSFEAGVYVSNAVPYNESAFRQNKFWPFRNFSTPGLTWQQYAATFSDVSPSQSAILHPFDAAFYDLVFKDIAKDGDCFGMSLEGALAERGSSWFAEPVYRYWPNLVTLPDEKTGVDESDRLEPTLHAGTINEMNIKQGYQVGGAGVEWTVQEFFAGRLHDPKAVFLAAKAALERGERPIITLRPEMFGTKGHAVLAYAFEQGPTKWTIKVANPNAPGRHGSAGYPLWFPDTDPQCRVEIDPVNNTFTYAHQSGETWTGGTAITSGTMGYFPVDVVAGRPETPFSAIVSLIAQGVVFICGSGATAQVTDGAGAGFYQPGTEQLLPDGSRTPDLARLGISATGESGPAPELFYSRAATPTYTFQVGSAVAGAPYTWAFRAGTLSAIVEAVGTPGKPDLLGVRDLGTRGEAVSVGVPAGAARKTFSVLLGGPVEERWIRLNNLSVGPGQIVTLQLSDGGRELIASTNGAPTSAEVIFKGDDPTPVNEGILAIDGPDGPDTTPPVTTSDALGSYAGSATIHLLASDGGSGVAKTSWKLDGGSVTDGTVVSTNQIGGHVLSFWSTDVVGNVEATKTASFTVIAGGTPGNEAMVPVEGPTRVDTAVKASQAAFASADTVLVATAFNFPDALGGSSLAGALDAPLLLTAKDSLPAAVETEIKRLGAKKAVILGSEAAVGKTVADKLAALLGGAASVKRIGGADRYATAALIASETVSTIGAASFDGKVFIATGENFPDALAASPLATAKKRPILLVRAGSLPSASADAIVKLKVKSAALLGSNKAVSDGVKSAVAAKGVATSRLEGPTRYQTAIAVAKAGVAEGLKWDGLAIATGTNYPDALSGGVMCGKLGTVLLLTDPNTLTADVKTQLTANKATIGTVRFLGSTAALSAGVRTGVAAALK